MPRFKITPRARDDLINIGRYTERRWGKLQRNMYLKDLEHRFGWLAENPKLGKQRQDIADSYHSFPQGDHVIFYLMLQEGIDVIGVPHKEMDILSYFLND